MSIRVNRGFTGNVQKKNLVLGEFLRQHKSTVRLKQKLDEGNGKKFKSFVTVKFLGLVKSIRKQ